MKSVPATVIAVACALALAACSDDKPAPKPAAAVPQAPAAPATPAAAAPAPAAAAAAVPKPDADKTLAARVKGVLNASKEVPGHQIDVTAKGGVVSLWGTVGDKSELEKAAAAARAVEGVKSVENNLKVVRGS